MPKHIQNTSMAGGDLEGTYPDPTVDATLFDTRYLKLDVSNDPITNNLKSVPTSNTTAFSAWNAPTNNSYYTKVGFDGNLALTASGAQNYTSTVSYVYLNSSSSSTGFIAGADLGAVNNMTAGQTATGLYGMNMAMYNYGNGTLSTAYGGYFAVYNYQGASGVTTEAVAGYFFIESFGGSTVSQYGVYVGPVSGATNNYSIFTTRGLHEFNDQVYIDGRQSITQLQIDAHSTQAFPLITGRTSAGTVNFQVGLQTTITSAASAVFRDLYLAARTQTISGTTNITTATGFNSVEIGRPTLSNSTITVTNAATVYIAGAPTTTGGMAITNSYSFWIDAGALRLDGNLDLANAGGANIITDTTTGTKIGTATGQKLGFWNATPIVQPTTAVAAATFTANTSGIADDTATFDGYTIGQVVKALRNTGILA